MTTARAPHESQDARRGGEVARQVAGRRRRIERRRNDAGDRRAEQRRQELFGVADDERDQIAAAQAEGAQRGRDAAATPA